jgi:hypothetical protein
MIGGNSKADMNPEHPHGAMMVCLRRQAASTNFEADTAVPGGRAHASASAEADGSANEDN